MVGLVEIVKTGGYRNIWFFYKILFDNLSN